MKNARKFTGLFAIATIALVATTVNATEGVSPGTVNRFATIRDECPAFSWEMVAGTRFYELVAYELPDHQQLSVEPPVELSEDQEVLHAQVPGGATSWTPELGRCLLPGGRYVWFVRAVFDEEDGVVLDAGEWSEGLFFTVAAAPSVEEVEQALWVLQRYLEDGNSGGGLLDPRDAEEEEVGRGSRRHGSGSLKSLGRSVLTAPSAIRGSMPDPTGELYGVVGISNSPDGAGVAVANTAGGADLVLDGSAQGVADTELSESGIDRRSSGLEVFNFTNSFIGRMRLEVDGVEVVTTATDQDTLGGMSCATGEVAKWDGSAWLCAADENTGLVLPYEDGDPTAGAAFRINNTSSSGNVFAVRGDNASTAGAGVFGWSTGSTGFTSGVVGQSSSATGTGVFGLADSGTGANYGTAGISASNEGIGVAGVASAVSGTTNGVYGESVSNMGRGVYGFASAGSGTVMGVYGATASANGHGVKGHNSATTGATEGVYGVADSTSGRGVFGHATSTTGIADGVSGVSDSDEGAGVSGYVTSSDCSWCYAVYGQTDSDLGQAIRGYASATNGFTWAFMGIAEADRGVGLAGYATSNTGTNYGVYGSSNSGTGWAGWFEGNVHVQGSLSKAAGAFKIDHPLDPANKYLQHSFVESPDMMNIYNGNVVLDENGEAWVEMPDWFEALNRDFRYQLTAIGAPGPNLFIAEKLDDRRFKIAGGGPNMEVSWQLTGIRHDPWANAHRIPVEVDKPNDERGTYLAPELFDQPGELGVTHRHDEIGLKMRNR